MAGIGGTRDFMSGSDAVLQQLAFLSESNPDELFFKNSDRVRALTGELASRQSNWKEDKVSGTDFPTIFTFHNGT
jgi:hypothetical protein